MRDMSLVMPYYMNSEMLRTHQDAWSAFPVALAEHLHVIIVDDGSPKAKACDVWLPPRHIASARLYRTQVDVRWNWLFCRNLAMSEATTEWALMTDIDHLLPEETLRSLLTRDLDPREVYRLARVDAPNLTPYKIHPNTWLMTRAMYDSIGGYDERFSGYYGSDGDFRDRVQSKARAIVYLSDVLIRYPRSVLPDASTTTYGRKEEQDGIAVPRIRAERDRLGSWKTLRLTFPWERLC